MQSSLVPRTPAALAPLLCGLLAGMMGCSGGQDKAGGGREVRVAAAADLKFAFDEVAAELEKKNVGIKVKATYGSSGNFYAQLSNEAPFDLYLSADADYPRKLVEQGKAVKESEFLYAVGYIVVWVPNGSKLDVEKLGMRAVTDPSVKKVAIANPKHAPYGRAAKAAMEKLGVYDEVKDRLVLGENIAQTAQFVESGAADVGLIALSLALAPALRDKGRYWPVPLDAYPRLEQGGVILKWAKDREAAEALRDFMTGKEGRVVLKKYGFLLPGGVSVDWTALGVTLKLAAWTTGVLLVLGLPLAWWLATARFRGKFLVEAVVALPLVLPPTVLGFYVLTALGPNSLLGRGYESLAGGRLPFTFAGILVGSVLFNLPFAVRPFASAFAAVDRRLVEASWCLGVSRLATFLRVVVPLSWPGILSGLVLTFAHTVGEFGVVLMVGGNIPGVTRTLALAIYDDVQALNYQAAGQTALVLLAFAFAALGLTYALQRRVVPL